MESLAKQFDSTLLKPYAVKHARGLGRLHPDEHKSGDGRSRFTKDEGRLLHSEALRRLEKTQVQSNDTPGLYKPSTRWSHSLEVAYLSEQAALALRVNHILAKNNGLGHDFGHPPFGHEGEEALQEWMKRFDLTFEHNEQTVRIVTLLEHHCDAYRGLNLNVETIDGFLTHTTQFDKAQSCERKPSIESQIANYADRISWLSRDIHDGIKLGILDTTKLGIFPLFDRAERATLKNRSEVRSAMISLLSTDLITTSQRLIQERNPRHVSDVYKEKQPLVCHSKEVQQELDDLVHYMTIQMYRPPSKAPFVEAVRVLIHALCDHYLTNPNGDVDYLEQIAKQHGDAQPRVIAVKDFIAKLTDRQACELARSGAKVDEDVLRATTSIFRP